MREQEDRIAREEEEEEAMFLTYDRPEMVNKVIFRRRPSTGTWEVVSPNEVASNSRSKDTTKQSNLLNHSHSLKVSPNTGNDVLNVHLALPEHSKKMENARSDPDYRPVVAGTKTPGKRPRGRPRNSDARRKLIAASCNDEVSSIQSNSLVNSVQSSQNHVDSKTTRTRIKQTNSSPSNDSSKLNTSPRRYPTRHKQ